MVGPPRRCMNASRWSGPRTEARRQIPCSSSRLRRARRDLDIELPRFRPGLPPTNPDIRVEAAVSRFGSRSPRVPIAERHLSPVPHDSGIPRNSGRLLCPITPQLHRVRTVERLAIRPRFCRSIPMTARPVRPLQYSGTQNRGHSSWQGYAPLPCRDRQYQVAFQPMRTA